MFVRKQKVRKKSGIKTYYCLVESKSGTKYPSLKNIRYLGTAEKILKIYDFYDNNKPKN